MEIVLVRDTDCRSCGGGSFEILEATHVPLFSHGGYGEATRIRARLCLDCWTVRELSRESVNPRGL